MHFGFRGLSGAKPRRYISDKQLKIPRDEISVKRDCSAKLPQTEEAV